MKVGDVMTPCPYKIDGKTPVDEAMKIIKLRGVRHLPVVEDGTLIGVISERDLHLALLLSATMGHCPVISGLCSKNPYVVAANDNLAEVARYMYEKSVDCALVSDESGENFVGIFTNFDACRVLHLTLSEK